MSDPSGLRDLYQDAILDRGRRPKHGKRLETFDVTAEGDNPMCGDRIRIWVKFGGRVISRVGFEARGCAISIAAADLMAEVVIGYSTADIRALFETFRNMLRTGVPPNLTVGSSGPMQKLLPLSGVHEYPSRVKCATLPWHALLTAADGHEVVHNE